MINEALYCERLLYLEWVQGEFADNDFTVEGRLVHRRADTPSGALPPLPGKKPASPKSKEEPDDDEEPGDEPAPYTARSVWLSSERLGITAKIDIVEGDATGRVVPIEYKRGAAPDLPEGAYLPERAQLCAQVLLLREHGYTCAGAEIYFAKSRRRVPIVIDAALEHTTLGVVARAREVTSRSELPAPLQDSAKCDGCSLVGICLPDEVNLLKNVARGVESDAPDPKELAALVQAELIGPLVPDPWELASKETPEEGLRRLHPARDDKLPLYVQEQGSRVGLDGDCLSVKRGKGGVQEVRLAHLSQVAVFGNVQFTSQALRSLMERGIPISFFSYGGWYYGRATGLSSKNVDLRLAQYRAAMDPAWCLRIARGLVVSKLKNSRTMLRRNHASPDPVALSELDQLARKADAAESLESLLGLEGTGARCYFGQFSGMLKGESTLGFDLEGRNRRPPRDPINALLSFAYTLLTKDFNVTLGAVGLDPLLGFYHQPRFGRPALALDLMEEFRPLVADSVVIGVINNGELDQGDFTVAGAGVAMKPEARKRVIHAYERRMDQLVTHPVFGYRISYRRVLEVQARLLGRVLLGELDRYPAFRTR
jgi:CRISPR-associated protein Cas1